MNARAMGTTFYTVVESRHFLGAVALVNSLRLLGHDEPIVMLDCGLTAEQRQRLEGEVEFVDGAVTSAPHLLKGIAPLARPSDVMVLLDADIIVTRRLDPFLEQAAEGTLVAFADAHHARFDERWSDLLDVGPLVRRTYVNSGFLAMPRELGLDVLAGIHRHGPAVDVERSFIRHGTLSDPFYFLDQDILNALLASEYSDRAVEVLDHRLAPHPPFPGVRVEDEPTLRCVDERGAHPFLLHHIQRKPWLAPLPPTVYSRLLSRLLLGSDVAIPISPNEVPVRLRPGALASLDRNRIAVVTRVRRMRRRLGLTRSKLPLARQRSQLAAPTPTASGSRSAGRMLP